MTYAAVVVVHNESVATSETCRSLLGMDGWDAVLVCDNSTEPTDNEAACRERGWTWLCMGGNLGLPAAYNRALDTLADDCMACLFDSDTRVPAHYLARLKQHRMARPEVKIWVPWVVDAIGILSPCRIRGCLTSRIRDWQSIPPAEQFSAINTGMAIDVKLGRQVRYDEGMFLDFVDHDFLRRAKAQGAFPAVIADVELTQRFSGSTPQTADIALKRFTVFRKDFTRFASKIPSQRAVARIFLCLRAARLALRYRDGRFLSVK